MTGELIYGLSHSVEVSLLVRELRQQRGWEELSAVRMACKYQICVTCCGFRDPVRVVVQHQEIIIGLGEIGGGRTRQRGRRTLVGSIAVTAAGSGPDACPIQELRQGNAFFIPWKFGTPGQKEGTCGRCFRVDIGLRAVRRGTDQSADLRLLPRTAGNDLQNAVVQGGDSALREILLIDVRIEVRVMIAEHRIGSKRRLDLRQDLENFLCFDDIYCACAVELIAEENHEIRMTCVYSVYHTLYMCSADN